MPDASKSDDIIKLGRILAGFDESRLDYYTREAVQHLRHAVNLMPMSEVLARVPGDDIIQKAERAKVSRSTWYAWKRGRVRPNQEQAQRLSQLTDIPADLFRGRR